ncbi:MAG: hypothetical protein OEY11_12630 [Gammaproteobacteria bacterium]|nr:hypothetical protein [Gammaproteobacteria bacterium]
MARLLLVFVFLFPCYAAASVFEDAYSMSARGFTREANRVAFYAKEEVRLDKEQQDKELSYLTVKLAGFETGQVNNPVYWFVRGLHARNMASFYQQSAQKDRVAENIEAKNKYYQTAMELDKSAQPHLSATAYAVMKPGLPDELKQYAIETELNRGGSGENESYYWYLHWSNINALSQQKRFDEAQRAVDRMQKELRDKGLEDSAYLSLLKKAEAEVVENKTRDQTKNKASRLQKHDDEKTSGFIAEYIFYLVWFAMFLAAVVVIFIYYLYEKKRKEK